LPERQPKIADKLKRPSGRQSGSKMISAGGVYFRSFDQEWYSSIRARAEALSACFFS